MLCTHRFEYHWADGTSVKKPIKCSAPKYIDYLMTWVQDQLDNESIFPSKIGGSGGAIITQGPLSLMGTIITPGTIIIFGGHYSGSYYYLGGIITLGPLLFRRHHHSGAIII